MHDRIHPLHSLVKHAWVAQVAHIHDLDPRAVRRAVGEHALRLLERPRGAAHPQAAPQQLVEDVPTDEARRAREEDRPSVSRK